jgi:hypothetical protein
MNYEAYTAVISLPEVAVLFVYNFSLPLFARIFLLTEKQGLAFQRGEEGIFFCLPQSPRWLWDSFSFMCNGYHNVFHPGIKLSEPDTEF